MFIIGAKYISQLLNVTNTLQELNSGNNEIGDDGIVVISEELQHNTSVINLLVHKCWFTVKGSWLAIIALHRLLHRYIDSY